MQPIRTAILGATGAVGQRFVQLLDGHPWFRVEWLAGSERRAGSRYGESVRWLLAEPLPDRAGELPLGPPEAVPEGCELAFSALPSEIAGALEVRWAEAGVPVVSNASAHRLDPGVPLIIPEVNPEAADLARRQPWSGRGGLIACNPNCTTAALTLGLAPLHRAFGVKAVIAASYQAISGAGYPGVPASDILGNVIPYIAGEEPKVAAEPLKILGAEFPISPHCARVPVSDGHLIALSVAFERPPVTAAELAAVLEGFRSPPEVAGLPSAPDRPLLVTAAADRPQPLLDRGRGRGMAVTVGRIRPCPVLGWSLAVLGHNTIRGAAGGAVLLAELLARQGLVRAR